MPVPAHALELLTAKIVVSAGIVITVTTAAERLGPRLGGLIAATPQFSVLALVFFTLEQGLDFAAESAFWSIPGVCATIPLYLGYLVGTAMVTVPRVLSIATGTVLGVAGFVATTTLLGLVPPGRAGVMPLAAGVCLATACLVRGLPRTARLARVRASSVLLVVRAGVSALAVIAITSVADVLGPKWSGLVTGFPVNSLPVMAILHFHYGTDVVKPLIRVWPAGAFGICLFNLTAWLVAPRLGLVSAIVLGYAGDLVYLVTVHGLDRWWQRRADGRPSPLR
jgi:hypothetical protein